MDYFYIHWLLMMQVHSIVELSVCIYLQAPKKKDYFHWTWYAIAFHRTVSVFEKW